MGIFNKEKDNGRQGRKSSTGSMDTGRYLAGGIDNLESSIASREVYEVPLDKIRRNPKQPRRDFDSPDAKKALKELSSSIKDKGVLQPIAIREIEETKEGERYEIVAGERRWRASGIAGLKTVPAIIMNLSEKDAMSLAFIENYQRRDLNFYENICFISEFANDYGSTEDASKELGIAEPTIRRYMRFYKATSVTPEIEKIIRSDAEAGNLNHSIISDFAKIIHHLDKTIKYSDSKVKRERIHYERLIQTLTKKGVKRWVELNKKKYLDDTPAINSSGAKKSDPMKLFTETDKHFVLNIRVNKGEALSPSFAAAIQENVDRFLSNINVGVAGYGDMNE